MRDIETNKTWVKVWKTKDNLILDSLGLNSEELQVFKSKTRDLMQVKYFHLQIKFKKMTLVIMQLSIKNVVQLMMLEEEHFMG